MEEIRDYVTYPDRVWHYDTSKIPRKQPFALTFLLNGFSKLLMPLQVKSYKIDKINMEGLKPPYIMLCSHHQFIDFELASVATYPNRVNNISTIMGFRNMRKLMESLGVACKRKFTTDLSLIKTCYKVVREYKDILCIYPEARYTTIGTTSYLPDSMGKLIKKCGVPVVVMLHHGNYLNSPLWARGNKRRVPLYSTVKKVLTAEQVGEMSAGEINEVIRREMDYDEYRWQKENNLRITEKNRAEGIHKVLYQCPECGTEFSMNSKGIYIFCEHCSKKWEMTELGELKALDGETRFTHIPDWYEWERSEVKRQLENGEYSFRDEVHSYSLPWTKSFIDLGRGVLIHNPEDGFILEGEYNGYKYRIQRRPQSMYGVHAGYDYTYIAPGDCVGISTQDDSFFSYPEHYKNAITKISLATEEIYKMKSKK